MKKLVAAIIVLGVHGIACAGFTVPVGLMGKAPPSTVEIDFTTGFPSGAVAARTGDPVFVMTSASTVVSRSAGAGGVYEPYGDVGEGGGCWTFPAFTNNVPDPNNHSTGAGWTGNLGTATEVYTGPNVVVAPDGTTTADTIADNSASGYCLRYYNSGTPANRTMSVWVQDHSGNAPTAPGMLVHDTSLLTGSTYGSGIWHRVFNNNSSNYTLSGIAPAGVQPGNVVTNSATGAVDVWGSQDVVSYSDLPLVNSATAASTIQIASGSLANILHAGDFDARGRVMVYADGNDIPIPDGYLFSADTPDGLLAVRFANPDWVLTVRGTDVITISSNVPAGFQRGAEIEWRAWYKPSTGHAGLRIRSNGAEELYDTTGSATGSPLATPTAAWIGSNLGASGYFTGKHTYFKTSANDANAAIQPEFVILGDSLHGPFYRFATTAGGIYTNLEARARPGIVSLAVAGEQINDQKARWDSSSFVGKSYVKAVLILVGMNDIITGNTSVTILGRLQTLINDIHGTNASAKIIIGTLTPARGYLDAGMYTVWQAVNAGIPSLTSVDAVFTGHTTALGDGSDYLNPICDSGDHIHPWNPCRMTIAGYERSSLVSLGLL